MRDVGMNQNSKAAGQTETLHNVEESCMIQVIILYTVGSENYFKLETV